MNENGTTSFADLQAAFQEGARKPLTYFAFDLLHLNGHNLRGLPLVDRKAILAQVVRDVDGAVRFSEHLESDGEVIFRKACELHAEGIVSKRAASPYHSGRGGDWLKLKCVHEQEFVVGGFTEPRQQESRCRRAAAGILRGRKASVFRPHRYRVHAEDASHPARSVGQTPAGRNAVRQSSGRSPQRRDLGQTEIGGPGELCQLDFRWFSSPSRLQRSARRQTSPRSSSRRTYGVAQAAHREARFPRRAAERRSQDDSSHQVVEAGDVQRPSMRPCA